LLKRQEVFSGGVSEFEGFKDWFLPYVHSSNGGDLQKILTAHSHMGGSAMAFSRDLLFENDVRSLMIVTFDWY
jgi:hypothetical protein